MDHSEVIKIHVLEECVMSGELTLALNDVYKEWFKFVRTCLHVCMWKIVVERTEVVNSGHL